VPEPPRWVFVRTLVGGMGGAKTGPPLPPRPLSGAPEQMAEIEEKRVLVRTPPEAANGSRAGRAEDAGEIRRAPRPRAGAAPRGTAGPWKLEALDERRALGRLIMRIDVGPERLLRGARSSTDLSAAEQRSFWRACRPLVLRPLRKELLGEP